MTKNKDEENSGLMREVVVPLLSFYALISFAQIFAGIIVASDSECQSKMSRIEHVFPAFRVGCWLGEKPSNIGEKNNERRTD